MTPAKRILLVDGVTPLRQALADQLGQNDDLEIDTAETGVAALERVGLAGYDAVVAESALADMAGRELVRRLRAEGEHCPVILLVLPGEPDGSVEGAEPLLKPFRIGTLLTLLRNRLREAGHDQQSYTIGPYSFRLAAKLLLDAATVLTASQTAAVNQLKAQQAAAQLAVQAQLQAAGGYSSGVTYQYARGPDGTTYVVGGSVSFDTQSIPGNPNATIAKMETVRRAALSSPQLSAAALQALASADVAIAQADAALRSGQSTGSALGAYAAAAGLASPANHNTHQVALAV